MAFEEDELNMRRDERREERQFLAKQQKFLKIGIVMTAVTLVLCAAALLITQGIVHMPQPTEPQLSTQPSTQTQPTETEPIPTEPDTVIHFVAGGDLNVTDKTVAAGTTLSGNYDYTQVFLDAATVLGGADLAAVNFEGSLFGAPYGDAHKSAPQQMMQALRNAGVDLVQAANSQSVVNGLSGLSATLQGIRAAGLEPVGAYETSQQFAENGGYLIRQVGGIKIAVVAFTKGMDGMGLPVGSEDCVNLLYTDYNSAYQKVDTDGITEILEAVEKRKPDVTIALLHWGSEFNNQISATQEKIRDLMLEKGVDAIIGTHSHYVQKVDFDAAKGTLVAYSLGDFLGDAQKAGTNYSVLLNLEITKDGDTGKVSITGYDYTPLYIADETATGGGMRILRIREAVAAYEENFVGKVSEETYLGMKAALEKIDSRMGKLEDE